MKADAEYLITQVINAIKGNFNTKIAEINAEKADEATLKPLQAKAYHFADFPGNAPAYDPCLIYQVAISSTDAPMGDSSIKIGIGFELIFSDELIADEQITFKRDLRYRRAIREIISEQVSMTYLVGIADYPGISWVKNSQSYFSSGMGVELYLAN